MEGISKETLEDYHNIARSIGDLIRSQVIRDLLSECKELDPWLPIDENTPKDKELLLYYPARENDDDFDMPKIQSVGYWSVPLGIWVCDLRYLWGEEKSRLVRPTHYQELPEAPL